MANRHSTKSDGAKDPHSTVLLVDSRGKVRTVQNFGRKIRMLTWLIVLSLLLCGGMGYFYTRLSAENARLQSELSDARQRLEGARKENEVLMARVVIAESAVSKPTKARGAAEAPSKRTDAKLAPVEPAPAPAVAERETPESLPKEPEVTETAPVKPPPKLKVEVGNFEMRFREDRSRIEVTYSLKNIGDVKAEGRSVVVLTTDASGPNSRLSIPRVWLEDGRPGGNRGRRFSIRKFMRVNLDREVDAPGVRIQRAEVFVFASSGELLTRKVFPADVKLPDKKPAQAAPAPDVEPAKPAAAATPAPEVKTSQPALPPPSASDVLGSSSSGSEIPGSLIETGADAAAAPESATQPPVEAEPKQ